MNMSLILIAFLSVIYFPMFDFYSGINSNTKSFKIFWNVRSLQCKNYGLDFTKILDKYNIIHNYKDSFEGDVITILYDPGYFPKIITDETGTYLRNGGVPQAGNLNDHLKIFEKDVIANIPVENNSGLAIIDHEIWRPIYRQNTGKYEVYQTLSKDLVKKEHSDWPDKKLVEEATKMFEESASKFMVETLKSAKKLRPKARWGYYHFPYCFSKGTEHQCRQIVKSENDRLMKIFELTDNLYPSVYLKESSTVGEHVLYIQSSLDEAIRIKNNCESDKKIYVYFWYKYSDTTNFIAQNDLAISLAAIAKYDIDGIILWGANADVNDPSRCADVYQYIDNIFGPIITTIL